MGGRALRNPSGEFAPTHRRGEPIVNEVYLQSCEQMSQLDDAVVDLTVTSPPYSNAIDYEAHVATPGTNYRPRQAVDYEEYLAFLESCFGETLRVTKSGGFCAVIIGTVLDKGVHTPLPFHLVSRLERLGWEFHQDIIWSKVTGGVKRAGSVIQNPYPGYFYPNIMTEYILVFRRPGARRIYQGRRPEEKERDRLAVDSVFTREIANNVWHIAPVPPGQLHHPCAFPEEIPYRLIRLYSYTGDLVLDPFCGVGTTPKAAQNLGRRWVGYEVMEAYREATLRRVQEPLVLRKQLVAAYDKIEYGERRPPSRPGNRRRPFRAGDERRVAASERRAVIQAAAK
jgi:site-specific DNA-methyltransferase (adenine-specific)